MIGLNANELKIFQGLSLNPQSVAGIARKTKLPRMTVYTNLLRLEKKRFAMEAKSETGKRVMWVKNSDSAIRGEIERMETAILGPLGNKGDDVRHYKGKQEVGAILMKLTTRKDGATMYAIQNAHNWWRWVEVMGKDWVNKHNRAVVEHKLVAFTIHSPAAPEKIKQDVDIIENYKGRHGNSHAIPEQFLKKDLSFYIFEDTILLVNLEKIEAILLLNKDMASFLVKMFAFMFEKAGEDEFFLKFNR